MVSEVNPPSDWRCCSRNYTLDYGILSVPSLAVLYHILTKPVRLLQVATWIPLGVKFPEVLMFRLLEPPLGCSAALDVYTDTEDNIFFSFRHLPVLRVAFGSHNPEQIFN